MVNPWHLLAVLLAIAVAFAASVTYVLFLDSQGPDALAARQVRNSTPADRSDCNAILGTAYRSDTERQWFSDNCSSWSASVGDVPDPGAPVPQVQASGPGPEGRDCGQVRGTPYRSDAERAWYVANCPAQTAVALPASAGPDRTDCNQIRGTAYRSDAERAWYAANCLRR